MLPPRHKCPPSDSPKRPEKAFLGKLFRKKGTATATPSSSNISSGSSSGMGGLLKKLIEKKKHLLMGKAKRGKFMERRMKLAGAKTAMTAISGKTSMGKATDYKKYLEGLKKATAGATPGGTGSGSGSGSGSTFLKRRLKLAGSSALGAAKATKYGKIALGVAAAGLTAQQYLKSKMKKNKNKQTLKDFREQKKPGIPSKKTQTINKAKIKLKKYTKGGGADTGTKGEWKSEVGVITNKLKRKYRTLTDPALLRKAHEKKFKSLRKQNHDQALRPVPQWIKDRQQKKTAGPVGDLRRVNPFQGRHKPLNFSKRTMEILKSRAKATKKMGGGMMQKPRGYKTGSDEYIFKKLKPTDRTGGGYDAGIPGMLRDKYKEDGIHYRKPQEIGPDDPRSRIFKRYLEAQDRKKKIKQKIKSIAKGIATAVIPGAKAAEIAGQVISKIKSSGSSSKKVSKGPGGRIGSKGRPITKIVPKKNNDNSRNPNPKTPKRMGGGMMQKPSAGFTSGGSVTVKTKIGKFFPTKTY